MPTLPRRGEQVIVQTGLAKQAHATIIDANGKVVQVFNFIQTLYIPTEKLQPGVYYIRLDGNIKSKTQKFVVTE